ncbi:MAG: hypothetical protein JO036_03755 [Candidatus Eremiobacteraeota bacterium]|nr:hypothetical protein [Candidatus Eremiobacteraeota bacterium]
MTTYRIKPELEPALIQFGRTLVRASIFFLQKLGDIVDLSCLKEGDDEYDYFLEVRVDELELVGRRVAELQRAVLQQFGMEITLKPKAIQS